jgi:hypothetical protein
MSFNASVNLGTVGFGITGGTVSISGCTVSDCSAGTSIVTGQTVTSFPKTITGIPDGTRYLRVQVDNGTCIGTVQCISISNIPAPTATPIPTATPGPTAVVATATPTPSPSPSPTPSPTPGPTATVYTYYKLRPCEYQGQAGYTDGNYDVWSVGYTTTPYSSGNRVEGNTGYYYVVVGSTTTDPGGNKFSTTLVVGESGCPAVAPPPTLRTAQIFAWSTASGPTLNDIKTAACGKMPYQLPEGYVSLGTAYISDPSITAVTPSTIYTLYDANSGGNIVNGGNKYYAVLYTSGGSVFQYVAYITTAGEIQDWTLCGSSPTSAPSPTQAPSPTPLTWYVPLYYSAVSPEGACGSTTLVNGYFDGSQNSTLTVGEYLYTNNNLNVGLPNGWYWYDTETVYQVNDSVSEGQIVQILACATGGGTGGGGTMYDCLGGVCVETVSGTYSSLSACQISGCESGSGGCFIEGTLVTMADGTQKPIEELVSGDVLMSYNIDTLPLYSDDNTVLNTWTANDLTGVEATATVIANTADTSHGVFVINGTLKTTGRHRHLIKRDGVWSFIEAHQVVVGDIMLDIDNNEVEVISKTTDKADYTIYKLDVEDLDVFYANNILTHNVKNTD